MLQSMKGLLGVSVLGREAQKSIKGAGVVEYRCTCAGPFGQSDVWSYSLDPIYGYGPSGPSPDVITHDIKSYCGKGGAATCLWSVQGNPNNPMPN